MKTILIKIKANWKAVLVSIVSLIALLFASDTGGSIVKCISGCFN